MDNFFFVGPTEREEVDQWLKEASPRTGRQTLAQTSRTETTTGTDCVSAVRRHCRTG